MAAKSELNMGEISHLDVQIATLMECKPLPETDVKALCERVSTPSLHFFLLQFMILNTLYPGQGDLDTRVQCFKRESTSHNLWRYPRSVPRLKGIVQNW